MLENIAAGFSHPNILDVKLGSRLWADDAPEAKRRKLDDVAKQTTSASLGFRIAGMKRWIGQVSNGSSLENKEKGIEYKDEYLCYNKAYGRSFAAHDVRDGFIEYFGGQIDPHNSLSKLKPLQNRQGHQPHPARAREHPLHSTRRRKQNVQREHTNDLRRRRASNGRRDSGRKEKSDRADIISRLDEGTVTDEEIERLPDSDDEEEELPKLYDIRLIDFAHAQFTPGLGPDNNVLHGVDSLIRIFKELAELATN